MGQASRHSPISGQRLEQLAALLSRLGLDPLAPSRPGGGGGVELDAASLAPIEEALTHTSSGRGRNHEQLEFLGDAVLRLAATEFLAARHPSLSVGQRSALRAQLVSDRWLAELADSLDLAPLLRLGPVALGDASGRATVLAECCEALVGAIYQLWGGPRGGLDAVLQWLSPAWERSSAELLADPERHNWKTALQEWSQGRGRGLPHYHCEEVSRRHGDPRRFRALVHCGGEGGGGERAGAEALPWAGEGWGGSRREAEQQAARAALAALRQPEGWSGER
jgi:ribonuclease-3